MRRVWIVSHFVDVNFIEHTGCGGNRSLGIAQAVARRSKKKSRVRNKCRDMEENRKEKGGQKILGVLGRDSEAQIE
jgi:hypothetical protein